MRGGELACKHIAMRGPAWRAQDAERTRRGALVDDERRDAGQSRRIRCGWAQHKQESAQASYAAVDRVRSCMLLSVGAAKPAAAAPRRWSVLWALWVLPGVEAACCREEDPAVH